MSSATMDCSTSSSSSEQTTETRQSEHYKEKNVEDDSGCNWDIEIAEFVVESFICLFPESRDGRRRVRQDTRGLLRAQNSTCSASQPAPEKQIKEAA